ncbi:succinylglutamate desuccinylase/aspartoacylase family protein [Breoghania sp. L-A4]|uniref:succinylglutamate desuccinylase/aspartoacylase family protein n=1 Tax=Breoghania sp. L-A4 TaxID=2304600 RepID=UPI000E35B1D0|nr:succinylglutamate desuccinylase/aspartoacylase family protein [Breoghania sp. L-A4]AXS38768.1 succinylglutamate desuccinylase [Breoghania sp. L-A4]
MAFVIGKDRIPAGSRKTVDLPFSVLSNHTPMTLPVHVVHGRKTGPTLFLSAAVHGDEILGVEIIRRVLRTPALDRLQGTLLAVPIVNAYGFINHSRYLPDRRDLNRSFPGSEGGSLAAQLADMFMREVVVRSDMGIDLHTAAAHRTNLPQIRTSANNPKTLELAEAFGAPVILKSPLRDGSLRKSASEAGVDVLLYEAGEALRFDEWSIRVGVKGILRVMKRLGMIAGKSSSSSKIKPVVSRSSFWMRAPEGGILRLFKAAGDSVAAGEVVGIVTDPFGDVEIEIPAPEDGIIIGRTNLPTVNQGDAIAHIARVPKHREAQDRVGQMEEELGGDPLFDEDEII